VYFSLGHALGLDWLRDRIFSLPRSTRWGALARGALRDDLFTAHRSLVADAIRTTPASAPAADRVESWLGQNQVAIDRAAHVLGDIGANESFDLATLSVGLREINNILRSAAATP
jgi:glutamate dehydrogenase